MTRTHSWPATTRTRRSRRIARALVVACLPAVLLSACSSSSSGTTTTTTSATTTSSVVPSSLPPTSVSDSSIKKAYATLFDLANPAIPPKLAVVQDGSSLKTAFTNAIHSALAKEAAGASVSKITILQGSACTNDVLPSPCATVVYDILGPNRKPVLTGSSGSAVYLSEHWLVAKTTICALLTLEAGGTTPSGC